jgi:CO dehydrogenase/acetyl-CoA synthase alpha subunit
MSKLPSEFDKFDRTMRELISVPHDEIKAALEAEKAEKQKKKRKAKKPSALDHEDGGED